MSVVNMSQEAFVGVILGEKKPALVDFWAPWCGHCRRLGPTLDQIARETPELLVAAVNIDDAPALARKYRVDVIPTLLAFWEGEGAGRLIAPESGAEIRRFLEEQGLI